MKNNLKFLVFSLFCQSGFLIGNDNDKVEEDNDVREKNNQSNNDISLSQTEKKIYNRIIDLYKVFIEIVLEDIDPSRPLVKNDTSELLLYIKNNYQLVERIMQASYDEQLLSRVQVETEFNFIINLLALYEKIIKNKIIWNVISVNFNEKSNLKLFQAIYNGIQQYAYLLEENQSIGGDNIKVLLQDMGNVVTMLLTLYTDINGCLKSGMGYFKIGFIKEQIFDKKKIILDNPNHYQRQYQNGILIDLVLEEVQKLQELFQLVAEIQKEDHSISRKNFFMMYNQFIYKTIISSISFLKFLIKTNFQFWGSEKEIKNVEKIKKYIERQVEIIEKEIKKKNDKKYFNQFHQLKFSEKIERLEKMTHDFSAMIIELNREEEQCRLYFSQKIYRKVYHLLHNISENGYLAQLIQATKNNFSNIFSFLMSIDIAYFITKRRAVLCDRLVTIGKDIWDIVNNATRNLESQKNGTELTSLYDLCVERANQLLSGVRVTPYSTYEEAVEKVAKNGGIFGEDKKIIFKDANGELIWKQGGIESLFEGEAFIPFNSLFREEDKDGDKGFSDLNQTKAVLSQVPEIEIFNMLLKCKYNQQQPSFSQGNVEMISLHREFFEKELQFHIDIYNICKQKAGENTYVPEDKFIGVLNFYKNYIVPALSSKAPVGFPYGYGVTASNKGDIPYNVFISHLRAHPTMSNAEIEKYFNEYKASLSPINSSDEAFYNHMDVQKALLIADVLRRQEKEKELYIDKFDQMAYGSITNYHHSGIADKLHRLPWNLGSIGTGFVAYLGTNKLFSMIDALGPIQYCKKLLARWHSILLGEELDKQSRGSQDKGDLQSSGNETRKVNPILTEELEKISLDGANWSHWPEEALSWFKNMIKVLEYQIQGKPVPNSLKNLSKSVYLIGQSGAGKSYLIECWSKMIASLQTEYKVNFNVNVVNIDPKHFDKDFHATATNSYVDLFEEISGVIEEARAKGEIYILVIDEAHLLFINKNTQTIDTARLAAGLKFFSELNNKQKYRSRIGGVYVVLATNRPSLIPHEFLANGGRIGELVYIPVLQSPDCINILKNLLKKNACSLDNIDFEYFEYLFSNYDLNYGKIEKIVNKAIYMSNILNTAINTEILQTAFDHSIRNIVKYGNREWYRAEHKKGLASYYAATTLLTYFFDKENSGSVFDCVTIAPIIHHPHPEDISKLYLPAREKIYSYGDIFTIQDFDKNIISEKAVLHKILMSIGGPIYLKKISQSVLTKEGILGNLFSYLFSYFANRTEYCTAAKKMKLEEEATYKNSLLTIGKFDDVYGQENEIQKKIQGILKEVEIVVTRYFENTQVKALITYLEEKLAAEYTLRKNNILSDNSSEELKKVFADVQIIYNEMIIEIKNIIHKYSV